jgi:hypothetical protein
VDVELVRQLVGEGEEDLIAGTQRGGGAAAAHVGLHQRDL